MGTAERVCEEIMQLPEPLLQEVLDFANFLRSKAGQQDLGNLMLAQEASLKNAWDDDADEVWNDVPVR